jgi:hypothetical protein
MRGQMSKSCALAEEDTYIVVVYDTCIVVRGHVYSTRTYARRRGSRVPEVVCSQALRGMGVYVDVSWAAVCGG